jgi:hypothetical protein
MASDFRSLVLMLARAALVCWSAVFALVAVGSLLADPAPFVLIAFGAAAVIPVVLRRHAAVALVLIATGAALVPTWVLAGYGEAEGGVSGAKNVLMTFLVLLAASTGLALVGYGLGRLVWQPSGAQSGQIT